QFISKAARSTSTARESKTAPRMAASAAASIKTVRLTVALAAAPRAVACGLVLAQTINNTTFESTVAHGGNTGTGGNGVNPAGDGSGGGLYSLGNTTVTNSTF